MYRRFVTLTATVVLLAAGAVTTAGAGQAAPPRPNPAWTKVCVAPPVLAGPWKRHLSPTCRLVLTPPGRARR